MFKPQLAYNYANKPQSSGYSQPKLDGIRCIAKRDGLFTRSGNKILSCNHIHNALNKFFLDHPNAILDGELYSHKLRSDFNKISSLVRKFKTTKKESEECSKYIQYHIYDMYGDNKFSERINYLKSQKFNLPIVIVETTLCKNQDDLNKMYSIYLSDGYEGQMVRNNKPYENKRSINLLKRKEFITEEFNVVDVLEGSGSWSGYAKSFILDIGDGRTFGSGVKGNQSALKALLQQKIKPDWVTVKYFEKSLNGVPRFPIAVDWGQNARFD